jgi:hypothetical protein
MDSVGPVSPELAMLLFCFLMLCLWTGLLFGSALKFFYLDVLVPLFRKWKKRD